MTVLCNFYNNQSVTPAHRYIKRWKLWPTVRSKYASENSLNYWNAINLTWHMHTFFFWNRTGAIRRRQIKVLSQSRLNQRKYMILNGKAHQRIESNRRYMSSLERDSSQLQFTCSLFPGNSFFGIESILHHCPSSPMMVQMLDGRPKRILYGLRLTSKVVEQFAVNKDLWQQPLEA